MDYGFKPNDLTAEEALLDGCPRCGARMLDLRHAGFSPGVLAGQRQCYVWADDRYTCNGVPFCEHCGNKVYRPPCICTEPEGYFPDSDEGGPA